jgi:hypothetical protein
MRWGVLVRTSSFEQSPLRFAGGNRSSAIPAEQAERLRGPLDNPIRRQTAPPASEFI